MPPPEPRTSQTRCETDIIFHTTIEMNHLADRRLGHMTPCFDDWKRFCFALREIASGKNGRPLTGFEAQKRAQIVLSECGYTWPRRDGRQNRTVVPDLLSETENDRTSSNRAESLIHGEREFLDRWGNKTRGKSPPSSKLRRHPG
jgi:hypothetical protein